MSNDEPITPDTKDWTWTAIRRCEQCGYDPAEIPDSKLAITLRATAPRWQAVLETDSVRIRPDSQTWSPLEYASHTRDVNELFAGRVGRMRTENGPHFDSWDGDAVAAAQDYAVQDVAAVAAGMAQSIERAAAEYDAVPDDGWSRTGFRSDGGEFTISSIGHYHLHDVMHHLHDVGA